MIVELDRFLIRLHFRRVSRRLKKRPQAGLGAERRKRRRWALDELDCYRRAGRLPHNTYILRRTPVFVDAGGGRCAVAHLIGASGNEALVGRTRARSNLARINEMDDPELISWASHHGLTIGELAEIQPGYVFVNPRLGVLVNVISGLSLVSLIAAIVGMAKHTQYWMRAALVALAVWGAMLLAGVVLIWHGTPCSVAVISVCHAAPAYAIRLLIVLAILLAIAAAVWVLRTQEKASLGTLRRAQDRSAS